MSNLGFIVDDLPLDEYAKKFYEKYQSADPFPHIIIDDFFPEETLNRMLTEFPTRSQIDWLHYHGMKNIKLASKAETQLGDNTRFFIYQLHSSPFLSFLEKLTGISGLIPDPHLVGGGLHQIERGGFLNIHADFNYNGRLHLDRRLNLLLYLNKNWREEYKGHLELWDRAMKQCVKKILPIFNRCVIFSTTDFAYHGHPEVLTCPRDITRKSIALYYYSNGRPLFEASMLHSTIFKERPHQKRYIIASVVFAHIRTIAKRLLPPVLTDLILSLRRRMQK